MSSPNPVHRVYLIPGLFGFGKLAGYDYFTFVERALQDRFARAGVRLVAHVVPAPPTASIASRARVLTRTILATDAGDGPLHLVGHSTGGLDARLLMDPATTLGFAPEQLVFRQRVKSVVGINTPHYGTPLAAYFTTAAGTRLLYLLSLFTVTSLTLGHLPLSIVARVLGGVEDLERRLGLHIGPLNELTSQLMRFIGPSGRAEVTEYLRRIRSDQAGIVQLMPEVMELFNVAVHDAPHVRYACVATAAPPPTPRSALSTVLSPYAALQLATYATLYGVASHAAQRYPYASPTAQQAQCLARHWSSVVNPNRVDGIVPTLSMLWGELLYCGTADHLDIVGHFDDGSQPRTHIDWLRSGARFDRPGFAAMADAVCAFLLRADAA